MKYFNKKNIKLRNYIGFKKLKIKLYKVSLYTKNI